LPESPRNHLTDEELNRYVDGNADLPLAWLAHIQACGHCRQKAGGLASQQRKLEALASAERSTPGSACADGEIWWRIALDIAPADDAHAALAHAARCPTCARKLRLAIEDRDADLATQDPLIQGLPSSTSERMAQQAHRLTRAARAAAGHSAFGWKIWLVGAAAILGAISGTLILTRPTSGDANRLLAQAYGERRVTELRFPGARYAPFGQERGKADLQSQALREASAQIAKERSRHPHDGLWLQSSGRAKLIEWRYRDALSELQRAEVLLPGDPSVLADLAAAYFERAQAGDSQADYQVAIDLLSQAIGRDTNNAELHFNRAIVLGYVFQFPQAIQEWEEFLRLEPTGDWASEARSRLAEVKARGWPK